MARIPLLGDLSAAIRLAARIIGKGDVILVHGAEYVWGPLVVGKLTRRPVVAVWHGLRTSEALFLPPAERRIEKAAIRFFLRGENLLQRAALRADATVVVSPTVAVDIRSRYGVSGKAKVIPDGVVIRIQRRIGHIQETRSSASTDGFPLRTIWVGTTAYKKGLDLAVEACSVARERGQEVSLTVVGSRASRPVSNPNRMEVGSPRGAESPLARSMRSTVVTMSCSSLRVTKLVPWWC